MVKKPTKPFLYVRNNARKESIRALEKQFTSKLDAPKLKISKYNKKHKINLDIKSNEKDDMTDEFGFEDFDNDHSIPDIIEENGSSNCISLKSVKDIKEFDTPNQSVLSRENLILYSTKDSGFWQFDKLKRFFDFIILSKHRKYWMLVIWFKYWIEWF